MRAGTPLANISRRAFVTAAAFAGASFALAPSTAFAEEESTEEEEGESEYAASDETKAQAQTQADALRTQLVSLQADLEAASEDYYRALAEQQAAQAAMEEEQAKIDETSARIEELQARLGRRARSMYKSGSFSALDFLLGSVSFEDFATNWALLQRMNDSDGDLIAETRELSDQLVAARDEYARQEELAELQANTAASIQVNTETRISVVSAHIAQLDAAAQGLLTQEQAEEAIRRAQEESANVTFTTSPVPVPDHGSVVDYALSRLGCPYIWGAAGPDSFDCSGLVTWCYAQTGVSLPHYTGSLYDAATNRVPVDQAQPGDVLYRFGHVGIAQEAGGVPYIHAPTFGTFVRNTDSLAWAGFVCALQFA